MPSSDEPRFSLGSRPALDGLRGCAIALVLALHIGAGLPGGFLGVEVFFVLSGFVITAVLLEESETTGRVSLRNFYARRALRLFPAFFTLLIVLAVYVALFPDAVGTADFDRDGTAAVFYVANWLYAVKGNLGNLLTHTWSLSVEEQFYLLWPLAVAFLVARRVGYRRMLAICAAGAVASAALRAVLYDGGAGVDRVYFGSDTRACALLIGCGIAVVAYGGWLPTGRLTIRALNVAALLSGCVILFAAREFTRHRPELYSVGLIAVSLGTAAIILAVLVSPNTVGARLLSWRPLRGLGRISYGVYLWHWPALLVVKELTPGSSHVVRQLSTVALALALPIASWILIESPSLRLRARFSVRHQPATIAVASAGSST